MKSAVRSVTTRRHKTHQANTKTKRHKKFFRVADNRFVGIYCQFSLFILLRQIDKHIIILYTLIYVSIIYLYKYICIINKYFILPYVDYYSISVYWNAITVNNVRVYTKIRIWALTRALFDWWFVIEWFAFDDFCSTGCALSMFLSMGLLFRRSAWSMFTSCRHRFGFLCSWWSSLLSIILYSGIQSK